MSPTSLLDVATGQYSGNFFRALLLVVAAVAHHISSTPPNVSAKTPEDISLSQEHEKEGSNHQGDLDRIHGPQTLNKIGMTLVRVSPYSVWLFTITEIIIRLSSSLLPSSTTASSIIRFLSPFAPVSTALVSPVTTLYFAAFAGVLVGYRIRTSCFATLGRHFTFTHTTLSEHQLVKDGPYSVVRHASYTGEVLVRGGMILMLICPGSWAYESGVFFASSNVTALSGAPVGSAFARFIGWALIFHICWAMLNTSFLLWRATVEDATLREKFGAEWDAYRKEVPYRFIPYVA